MGLTEEGEDLSPGQLLDRQRMRHRLSCCFVDLDGFKIINDREGHMAGNRVLARTGDLLRSGARRYDLAARFGGDEFVVVLPETALRDAQAIAGRMCQRLARGLATMTDVPVAVSAGVAEWRRDTSAAFLLESADSALRTAKETAGSRVAVAPNVAALDADKPLRAASGIIFERYSHAEDGFEDRVRSLMIENGVSQSEAILMVDRETSGRRSPGELPPA